MPFVIDVDPVAYSLFGFPIRWYGLILVAAVAIAIWLAQCEGVRRGLAARDISDGAIWVGVSALVGGRLLYVLQNELAAVAEHPAHLVMVWMGGLSFYGGLIGGLLALVAFTRRRGIPLFTALDVAAPAAALGQAIGHVGCLIGGDSYGLPTNAPWAIVYRNPAAMAPQGIPLHPTQAYEAILLGALFVTLWVARGRLQALGDGVMASAYLLGLAAIRFALFFVRDEVPVFAGLKTAQILGVGVAGLGVVLFVLARHRARRAALPTGQLEVALT